MPEKSRDSYIDNIYADKQQVRKAKNKKNKKSKIPTCSLLLLRMLQQQE